MLTYNYSQFTPKERAIVSLLHVRVSTHGNQSASVNTSAPIMCLFCPGLCFVYAGIFPLLFLQLNP